MNSPGFWRATGLSAAMGGGLSALALMLFGILRTGSPWTGINATSHILHGVEAGQVTGFDLTHTGTGLVIHFGSSVFWAVVAVWLLHRRARRDATMCFLAGLATGVIALALDYGILPRALSPGWHLVLSPAEVAICFLVLGLGLSLGLAMAASLSGDRAGMPLPLSRRFRPAFPAQPEPPTDRVTEMRRPGDGTIDQRQQRIDPTNAVTRDPNRQAAQSTKQPGRDDAGPTYEGKDE